MKLPKELQRYCPYCRKHTKQTLAIAKQKSRSSAHPLSRSSTARLQARGLRVGYGNQGRFSKKGVKDWKRKTKATKRLAVLYTCTVCKKIKGARKSIRVSRIEIGEKVAK